MGPGTTPDCDSQCSGSIKSVSFVYLLDSHLLSSHSFGEPGVEFYGQHHAEAGVNSILFVPNQGRLVTRCGDNSLHLWEITEGGLNEVESHVLVGKLKSISAVCMESSGELLLLGTEGGNVYFINLKTFCMLDTIIYLDIVMQKYVFFFNFQHVMMFKKNPLAFHRRVKQIQALWKPQRNSLNQITPF